MARWVLALTVVFVGVFVAFVARPRNDRVFLLDLGRVPTPADRARAIRVLVVTAVATLVGVVLAFVASSPVAVLVVGVLPVLPTLWLVAEMVLVVRNLPPPTPARFLVPLSDPPAISAYISWPLQLVSLVLVSVVFATSFLIAPSDTEHWRTLGRGAGQSLAIMLFLVALSWFIAGTVARQRWALPTEAREAYWQAQFRGRKLLVRMLETLVVGVNLGMAVAWLSVVAGALTGDAELAGQGVFVSIMLTFLAILVPLTLFIGPLLRTQDILKKLGGSVALGTRANGWKWGGLVYFAPEDPAVFVPKQRGIGQTINFARPGAWVFLGVVLLAGPAISLVGRML
jgi:uncharacterized membrane protein